MLVAGLQYPVTSAALGAAWCAGRVVYAVGYVKSKREQGKGRYYGGWHFPAELVLMFLSAFTAWKMLPI